MTTRRLTISEMSGFNTKRVPVIRLSGKWLEKLGFEVGRKVEIEESPERLVLTLLKPYES